MSTKIGIFSSYAYYQTKASKKKDLSGVKSEKAFIESNYFRKLH